MAFIKMEILLTLESDILLSGGDGVILEWVENEADEKMKSVGEDTFIKKFICEG